jgi:hypothetical protein
MLRDYTSFSEVNTLSRDGNPPEIFTGVTPHKIAITTSANEYYEKNAYITSVSEGNFQHLFEATIKKLNTNSSAYIYRFRGDNTEVALVALMDSSKNLTIELNDDASEIDTSVTLNLNTKYYFDIKRIGTTVTVKIYTSGFGGTLIDTLSISCSDILSNLNASDQGSKL